MDESDPAYANRLIIEMCETLNVRPQPRVVLGTGRDGDRGLYHAASRMISLSCSNREFVDVLAHELQHHLDELSHTTVRGRHDAAFYLRLNELRIELGLSPDPV